MFCPFTMYNIQYRMMSIILWQGPYPMQLWEWINQSYQLNQSISESNNQSNNLYINDILLPTGILIVGGLNFYVVSDIVYYD
jgi:hypothetical protein